MHAREAGAAGLQGGVRARCGPADSPVEPDHFAHGQEAAHHEQQHKHEAHLRSHTQRPGSTAQHCTLRGRGRNAAGSRYSPATCHAMPWHVVCLNQRAPNAQKSISSCRRSLAACTRPTAGGRATGGGRACACGARSATATAATNADAPYAQSLHSLHACGAHITHQHVHVALQLRDLARAERAVHHDARVEARVHDDAHDPLRLAQAAAAQQQVVGGEWALPRRVVRPLQGDHGALEAVQVGVGRLGPAGSHGSGRGDEANDACSLSSSSESVTAFKPFLAIVSLQLKAAPSPWGACRCPLLCFCACGPHTYSQVKPGG